MATFIDSVADGLFAVCATMGIVPIIRCPKDNAAEHVAKVSLTSLLMFIDSSNLSLKYICSCEDYPRWGSWWGIVFHSLLYFCRDLSYILMFLHTFSNVAEWFAPNFTSTPFLKRLLQCLKKHTVMLWCFPRHKNMNPTIKSKAVCYTCSTLQHLIDVNTVHLQLYNRGWHPFNTWLCWFST